MCLFVVVEKHLCKKKLAFPLHNQYPQFQYSPERLSQLPLPASPAPSPCLCRWILQCALDVHSRAGHVRGRTLSSFPLNTLLIVCLWKSMPSSWSLRQCAIKIFFTSFFMWVTDCLTVGFLPYLVWELLRNCLPHRQRVYACLFLFPLISFYPT